MAVGGRYMISGVTIFCIDSGKYFYLESGGSDVYTTTIDNRGRLMQEEAKRTTR